MSVIKKIPGILQSAASTLIEKGVPLANEAVRVMDEKAKELGKIDEEFIASDTSEKVHLEPDQAMASIAKDILKIEQEVFHSYIDKIYQSYIPVSYSEAFSPENQVNAFHITRFVTAKDEDSIDKLKNVYGALSQEPCSLALIFDAKRTGTSIYMAVTNLESSDPFTTKHYCDRLKGAVLGNFPGSELTEEKDILTRCGLGNTFGDSDLSIAMVTNIATEKSEKFISQSIEKLLDGFSPKTTEEEYCFVLLAKPCKNCDITELRQLYASYYSAISKFQTMQFSNIASETNTLSRGLSLSPIGVGAHIDASISQALSSGVTLTSTLFQVKHTMEQIEAQIKRLEQGLGMGMWEFSSYVLSQDANTSIHVANMYRSLAQGEESFLESGSIHVWHESVQKDDVDALYSWIQKFQHPIFCVREGADETLPNWVSGATLISSVELARALSLPKTSVQGLTVLEGARFGRNVLKLRPSVQDFSLGHLYHMYQAEANSEICLTKSALTAHTFITGSTGSGKSNTIYHMLDKLSGEGVKFMVVEPAKGEYKEVFGGREDVTVYGTNLKKSELLRINPFSFPDDIHVLEHIDRLIEIFNACWPMYAAMPAVLKDAVEQAYIKRGWSLTASTSASGTFPTFRDLLTELPLVMEQSAYSKDTKGDYVGALVTRVKSLTNGINGLVFCGLDELSNEALFDENIIVDLSRVGSSETKSLIMGLMVMKLQEYRMCQGDMNSDLKHVTVLEEAHNLLRRTASEQSQEGSNLQGKSVEMLANAIAEMRTYGEGFIIADQSPGLLDLSVIRNTNTKILMRLPDQSDRELVGKSIGLNDDQIMELSKLEVGVAAVYQNDWLEAVLCKINYFDDKSQYDYTAPSQSPINAAREAFLYKLIHHTTEQDTLIQENADSLKLWIAGLDIGSKTKNQLFELLELDRGISHTQCKKVLYEVVRGKNLSQRAKTLSPDDSIPDYIAREIMDCLQISQDLAISIRRYMLEYISDRKPDSPFVDKMKRIGGVF